MTVVVFVDVQNDFVKGGALEYKYPVEPNHERIVEFANKCRRRGYQLFATRDTHTKNYPDTLEGKKLPIEHCMEKTEGHRMISGLQYPEDGIVNIPNGHIIDKTSFGSGRLALLMNHVTGTLGENIDRILICGYYTSICVVSNALILRSAFPNVPICCVEDLCGDIDVDSHRAGIKVMYNCMIDVMNSEQV